MIDQDEIIRFQACNPKRQRTAVWARYEKYKVATTVDDALKLGATGVDVTHDLKHCFCHAAFRAKASTRDPHR